MLFRDISYYLDQAKEKNAISSDRKLSEALGYKGPMLTFMRKGHNLPSPEKMVEIANLAGIDEETALIDLCIWSTRGKAQQVYANILQKISAYVLIAGVILATCSSVPARAEPMNFSVSESIHYHSNTK